MWRNSGYCLHLNTPNSEDAWYKWRSKIVQQSLNKPIVVVGCASHIVNNTIQTAMDCIQVFN
ncbi:hypothetical protein PR048_001294, partial [Dryococelus australis]